MRSRLAKTCLNSSVLRNRSSRFCSSMLRTSRYACPNTNLDYVDTAAGGNGRAFASRQCEITYRKLSLWKQSEIIRNGHDMRRLSVSSPKINQATSASARKRHEMHPYCAYSKSIQILPHTMVNIWYGELLSHLRSSSRY